MRAAIVFVLLVAALYGAREQYNLPECGTAPTCGHVVHDFLHKF